MKRRMCENHFVPGGIKRHDGPAGCSKNQILAGSHSSKLQHRAPLEIHPNLSHVRKTLESGIPVPPFAQHLSMLPGSGFCVAREPRLPRVPVLPMNRANHFLRVLHEIILHSGGCQA